MRLVLDSSATLGWIYPDEANDRTVEIFEHVVASGAWVPAIWRLEVANSFQIGIRRGRIDRTFRDTALSDLAAFDISVDPDTDRAAWAATLHLSDRFRLTLYDASYLELAQRRSLPLATLDRALNTAAQALGVPLLGE